jgi:hypothetical protein
MAETTAPQSNPQINVTLSMLENRCDSFTFTADSLRITSQPQFDQYEFSFTINFNLTQASLQARINVSVKLVLKEPDGNRIELAELKSTHLFLIQNFNQIIQTTPQGQMLIPNPVLEVCNGVSISSIRGMFSVKTEKTLFSNAVLPLVDPKTLIPNVPVVQ